MTEGKGNIEDFIPQRVPFVFIDTIEERSPGFSRTCFTVREDCVLVTDGRLPLAGLMENAAQTCAVQAGNRIGYIGAVKQMEVRRFPRVGETLTTEARLIQEVLNISLFECRTFIGTEQIATTTLKIAIME